MIIIIFFIIITIMMIFEGATMVEEGEVRKGKTGGSVVCYRGAWLPQVIITVIVYIIVILIVIVLRWGDTLPQFLLIAHLHNTGLPTTLDIIIQMKANFMSMVKVSKYQKTS